MKKTLIVTLALVFVLGLAGTAFAANPFVDVPAKHWSYDAVAKLAQAGIVDGYGDGTFRGDKLMTRYEMAQIVAKAMTREDKANAEQKALINKLMTEYKAELDNLGVRVGALEKKAALDTVNINGEFRTRYEHKKIGDATDTARTRGYLELDGSAQINNGWTAAFRYENERNFAGETAANNDGDVSHCTRAYVTGPFAGATLTAGRFGNTIGTGLVFDDNASGVALAFGNALKVTLATVDTDVSAHLSPVLNPDGSVANDGLSKVNYAQFNYDFSKVVSGVASYQQWKDRKNTDLNNNNIWDVGLTAKLSNDWSLKGNYAKSNRDTYNKAYNFIAQYGNADNSKAKSFDVWAGYQYYGTNASTGDNTWWMGSYKGPEIGFHYVIDKNIKMTTVYVDGKNIQNTDQKIKYFRSQVEFFF